MNEIIQKQIFETLFKGLTGADKVDLTITSHSITSIPDESESQVIVITYDTPGDEEINNLEYNDTVYNIDWVDFLNTYFKNYHMEFPHSIDGFPHWRLANDIGWQKTYVLQWPNRTEPDDDVAGYCNIIYTDQSIHINIVDPKL